MHVSGCRAASRPPGFHTTTRELQTCTLGVPALHAKPEFHEKTHKRVKNNENEGGRGKKKREILGPHPSGPHPSEPHTLSLSRLFFFPNIFFLSRFLFFLNGERLRESHSSCNKSHNCTRLHHCYLLSLGHHATPAPWKSPSTSWERGMGPSAPAELRNSAAAHTKSDSHLNTVCVQWRDHRGVDG